MMHEIPKYLITSVIQVTSNDNPTGRYWVNTFHADGSRGPHWTFATLEERDAKAKELAEEHNAEIRERSDKEERERELTAAEWHEKRLEEIRSSPMQFVDRDILAAVPTLGAILSDAGLEELRQRFPDSCILPVSKRVAYLYQYGGSARFAVVEWEGKGVAISPLELEAYGLEEAKNWIPDLTGVPWVPDLQDFARAGFDITLTGA